MTRCQIASNKAFLNYPEDGYHYDNAYAATRNDGLLAFGHIMSGLKKDGSIHVSNTYGVPIDMAWDAAAAAALLRAAPVSRLPSLHLYTLGLFYNIVFTV